MNAKEPSPIYSRRRFFIAGGASVLGAATLAACAKSSVVNTSGPVPSTSVTPTAPPTTAAASSIDAGRSLLRTLTSVETSLVSFYDSFLGAAYLDDDAKSWGTLFREHHTANAKALQTVTTTAGGKAYTGPNKYLDDELVTNGVAQANALKSSSQLVELAVQLEETATSTAALAVASLVGGDARQGAMAVGATNSRHAYLWRLFATPASLSDSLPDALLSVRDALPASASVDPAPSN